MKILHLAGEPEDVGGVLTVIRNLQTASRAWNWQHTVCVHRDYQELRRPSLQYHRSAAICSDLPSHAALLLRAVRTYFELKPFLATQSFDVLHAHSRGTFLVGVAIASFLRRPVLFTNHTYAQRVNMYRWAARCSNFHTAVLTPNMVRHYGLKENQPRVAIVSECCADEFFRLPLVTRRARPPGTPLRFAGVGNIMRWKKWDLIAAALAQMPSEERGQIVFSLWGPTPNDPDSIAYDRQLREQVRGLRLEQQFLFRGNTHSIAEVLREADWFLLPSTNEPCSVALIEALALGLPALVSASGGNVDILQPEKTGLLFEPGNANDLAAKLRTILRSEPDLLSPAEIRESVKHRSATEVAGQYRVLYEKVRDRVESVPTRAE